MSNSELRALWNAVAKIETCTPLPASLFFGVVAELFKKHMQMIRGL